MKKGYVSRHPNLMVLKVMVSRYSTYINEKSNSFLKPLNSLLVFSKFEVMLNLKNNNIWFNID